MHHISCIVFYSLHYMHFTLQTVFYALFYIHCIICIVFYGLYSMRCILCIVLSALYSMHCMYSMHYTVILKEYNKLWNSLVTDRQTDRPTDRRTLSDIELLSQLKILERHWKYGMEVFKECSKTVKFILCLLRMSIKCQEEYYMRILFISN